VHVPRPRITPPRAGVGPSRSQGRSSRVEPVDRPDRPAISRANGKERRKPTRTPEIAIPDDVYGSLQLPEDGREAAVRKELAVSLYDRGVLPFGKVRALADPSKLEFHRLLGEREIPRHYTAEELDEDIEYTRE
jgi:predicted HTH domain antitoxin